MTAANYKVQIKIDAETGGLVGEAKAANDAIGGLGNQAKKTGDKLEGMGRDGKKVEKSLKNQRKEADKTAKKYKALGMAVKGAIAGMIAFVGVEVGGALIHQADNFQLLESRIERLSDTSQDAASNYSELISIASRTGADIGATVQLWESLTASLGELGYRQEDINGLVGTLQKLGTIGGSSGEEMSNALRQLSQSFAGGIVRAEEWNSVIENMPEVWRRVATGLGVSLGELRQMMLDGQLTSEKVMGALESQARQVNAEFAKMPRTVGAAAKALTTKLGRAISDLDEKIGATKWLADLLDATTTAVSIVQSYDAETDDTDALMHRKVRLKEQIAEKQELINQLEKEGVTILQALNPFDGVIDAETAKRELQQLQAELKRTEDKYKDITGLRPRTPEEIAAIKDKPQKVKEGDDDSGTGATDNYAQRAKAAQDHFKQLQRQSFDEIALLEAQLDDELALIKQFEQNKLYSKDAAKNAALADQARTAAEQDTANQISRVLEGDQATEDKEADRLAKEKEAQQAKFALFQQQYADERALIEAEYQSKMAQWEFWNEAEIGSIQERNALKLAIEKEHQDNIAALEQSQNQVRINAAQSAANSLMSITGNLAGEQSGAYRAMFALTKGMALAESTMNMFRSISQAMAMGYPQNIPLMAQAAAQGAGIISQITALTVQGQAHDGITRVPKEGTWNLAKGERVYTNESANQLDKMYDRIMAGASQGGAGFTIINVVDQKLVEDFLNSASGADTLINVINGNRTEVRQAIGV